MRSFWLILSLSVIIEGKPSNCGINSDWISCWNKSVSVQNYPYHASIQVEQCEYYPYSWWSDGVIISDRYILTTGDKFSTENKCRYTVLIVSDAQNVSSHKAELLKIDGIEPATYLLKLEELIELGPQALPIGLMKKGVKTGDQAILTKPIVDRSTKDSRIFEYNVTVINEQDCKTLLEKNGRYNRLRDGSFCTELPPEQCSYPLGSPLAIDGRLAGLLNDDTLFRVKGSTLGKALNEYKCFNMYLNISHHRAIIKEHMGTRIQPMNL